MKLSYSKITEERQGIPHIRWEVKNHDGVTVASTRTRQEARSFVRQFISMQEAKRLLIANQ